jgi:hypothetical protein
MIFIDVQVDGFLFFEITHISRCDMKRKSIALPLISLLSLLALDAHAGTPKLVREFRHLICDIHFTEYQ